MVSLQCQLSPFHLSPAVKSNVLGDLVSQFSQKYCVKDKIRRTGYRFAKEKKQHLNTLRFTFRKSGNVDMLM